MPSKNCNQGLESAVHAVITSFKSHSDQDHVDAVEALKEFWQLKQAKNSGIHGTEIYYHSIASESPSVCYVTLPGGSCFGSFETCFSLERAKQSAAKIALTNSVLNEHSCNIICASTIKEMLSAASVSFPVQASINNSPLEVFHTVVEDHIGKSFLSFQEKMSVFQLLHWNGSLKTMKEKNCSRSEVLQHYLHRGIDQNMRNMMVLDWIEKEIQQPGVIYEEMRHVEFDLKAAREAGHELRFHFEKWNILQQAFKELNNF